MRILSMNFGTAGHKVLVDHGEVLYNFNLVPDAIKPFVYADWLIYYDQHTVCEWLYANPKGRAILFTHDVVLVPRRCSRANSLRQIDRILRAKGKNV